MTDNDRILCQVLEQQLSLRLREGCRDVLLHLLPAPLRGLLYIALRQAMPGCGRGPARWKAAGNSPARQVTCGRKRFCAAGWPDDGVKDVWPALFET